MLKEAINGSQNVQRGRKGTWEGELESLLDAATTLTETAKKQKGKQPNPELVWLVIKGALVGECGHEASSGRSGEFGYVSTGRYQLALEYVWMGEVPPKIYQLRYEYIAQRTPSIRLAKKLEKEVMLL